MNLIPGVVESGVFRGAGLSVDFPGGFGACREITLGIRPEDVEFSTTDQLGFTPVRVWVTEDLGNETLIRLAVGGIHITLRAPAGTRADFDTSAWFRIRPEKIHWFNTQTTEALAPI